MQTIKIKSIEKIESKDKYELEVADNANFFANGILKHNCRLITIVDNNGNTTFLSRTGKTFDTLDVVAGGIKAISHLRNVVLDGELCLIDENGNEDFQSIMKEIRKKDHTIPNPSYKIFDMISHDEFYSKKGDSNKSYSYRYNNLQETMKTNECACLSVLEQERVKDDNHFNEWVTKSTKQKWEGLILRADEPYKGKRSKDLLKYKSFFDDEYEILDVEFGPFRYIKDGAECEETMLSCVMIDHKGYTVRVGSGFTIEERQEFYKNPKKILNKIATIQYFAESQNQDGGLSLRFPTLKFLHGTSRSI